MKIKTRLHINALVSISVLLLILLSIAWSYYKISKATRDMDLVAEMQKIAFERIILRDDYLLNQEERARVQWQVKSETLKELLESASGRLTGIKAQALLKEAHANFGLTFASFSQFMEKRKKDELLLVKQIHFSEAESMIIGQVFLKAYSLNDNINKLYNLTLQARTIARDREVALILVSLIIGVFVLVKNSTSINSILTKRIDALAKGVELVGAGDFDYRIATEGDDELTALSLACNKMAEELSRSYTSIRSLEKEIALRKQTESALRETSGYLNNLIDYANAPIIVWDPQFKVTRFNTAFESLTGRSATDILGCSLEILFPRDQIELSMEIIRKTQSGERWKAVEIRILHIDGSIRIVLWNSATLFATDGRTPIATIAQGQDITERKQAEEALRESRAKLEAALNSMTDAVFISDTTGKFIELNNAFASFHRFPSKDECLKRLADYPDILEMFLDNGEPAPLEMWAVPRALRGETVTNAVYTLRRKDTKETWVGSYSFSPIRDKTGLIIGSVVVGRDITELKLVEEQMKRTLADLERSNKELEQFAYVASHDLQEPLRMVSSYTQLLAKRYEGQLDDKAKMFIDYAVDGAVRMQHLINDLLAYSRVNTQGKTFERVDAHSALGEALKNLSVIIKEKKALVINDDLPEVQANAGQLTQLFQNLIGNAIKFKGDDLPRIVVSADKCGDEWRFSVKDNGIGIEAQYAEKIFVIFQRLHTRQEYPGTGIGLSICKRIVERHGGRIWFESEPGVGSTFYFTLPKIKESD